MVLSRAARVDRPRGAGLDYWRHGQVCQALVGALANKAKPRRTRLNPQDRARLERRAGLLKSLAHPSRLLIIELLEEGPRCVGELTEAVGADITTVSKHLAVLKRAGLVRDEKRGTYSEYSLLCDCVSHLVDCVEAGMAEPAAGAGAARPSCGARGPGGRVPEGGA